RPKMASAARTDALFCAARRRMDMDEKHCVYKWVASPVGRLKLVATDRGLAAILWEADRPRRVRVIPGALDEAHPILVQAERQLAEYFRAERSRFALPLDVSGTPFQRTVWTAL